MTAEEILKDLYANLPKKEIVGAFVKTLENIVADTDNKFDDAALGVIKMILANYGVL